MTVTTASACCIAEPRSDEHALITDGAYSYVRHPMCEAEVHRCTNALPGALPKPPLHVLIG